MGVQDFLAAVQRDLNCLSDSDRSLRKRALEALEKRLFVGDATIAKPAPEELQELVATLIPPVIRLLSDSVEKCRELSVQLLSRLLAALPDPSAIFPRLLPALDSRIGLHPAQEPSEEIRLSLLQLLLAAAGSPAGARLADFVPEASRVLSASLADSFHEIKKAACLGCASLAKAVPRAALEPAALPLLNALIANLSHRHSQVRQACLRAVDALVCAAAPASAIAEAVAPGVRPIAFDHTPAVRELLLDLAARWAVSAPAPPQQQQPADGGPAAAAAPAPLPHAPQLLPLLLLGVTDESTALAERALSHVEAVGAAWAEAEAASSSSSSSERMEVDGGGDAAEPPSPSGLSLAAAAAAYPPPLRGRPPPGARRMVAALLPQLLPPVLRDLREWTLALRAAAARLLHTLLVLSEGHAEAHLGQLLPALAAAVGDDDAALAARLVACAHALGAHVPARAWAPIALEQAALPSASPAARASSLVILAALLRFSSSVGPAEAAAVADALAADPVRSSDADPVRAQALACATNLIAAAGPACRGCSRPLFHSLLALSAADSQPAVAQGAADQLRALSAAAADSSSGAAEPLSLHALHGGELIAELAAQAPAWASADAAGRGVLCAFLRSAPPAVLRGLAAASVTPLLAGLLANERDLALRLSLLQALDALFEDPERGPALLCSPELAELAVSRLLLPSLVWRAGKPAAAVRFAAVVALGTALRRGLVPQQALLSSLRSTDLLASLHGALEEDFYTDTRAAAAHAELLLIRLAGPRLSDEQRRAIYPELTKRMDDSRPEIRVAAAGAVRAFLEAMPLDYCETNTGYLLKAFIVHMDDADPGIQEAVCAALEAGARRRPGVVAREVEAARGRHRSPALCDRVLAAAAEAKAGGAA